MNLNKIIELPLEMWVMMGEIGGPEVWRVLTLAIPNMGRYSLNEKVQIRTKNIFLKESIELKETYYNYFHKTIRYKLPNGELHDPLSNDNGDEESAYMKYSKRQVEDDYKLIEKKWYKNGEKHREDGPARIRYYENGNKDEEEWLKDNKTHREDGPAWILYDPNRNNMEERWYLDNKIHREDGPAKIKYYENGNKKEEWWYKDDKRHREDGPAKIEYYENGNKEEEVWYKDDYGPVRIRYNENGDKWK